MFVAEGKKKNGLLRRSGTLRRSSGASTKGMGNSTNSSLLTELRPQPFLTWRVWVLPLAKLRRTWVLSDSESYNASIRFLPQKKEAAVGQPP